MRRLVVALLMLSRSADAYSAGEYIALFATELPDVYAANPGRVARVAVGAERAEAKLRARFRRPNMLGPTLATIAIKESRLAESVHDGSRRGRAGEICLTQIHPVNTQWKPWAPAFESLAGTDVEATERCFLAAAQSLTFALSYCHKRRYYRNWAKAMFSAYHYGGKCWLSPHAGERTALMLRLASTKWTPTKEQIELLDGIVKPDQPELLNELPEARDGIADQLELVP